MLETSCELLQPVPLQSRPGRPGRARPLQRSQSGQISCASVPRFGVTLRALRDGRLFRAPPEMPPGSARPVFRLRTSLPACSRALRASASRSALLASRVGPWDVYLRLTPDTLRGEAFRFAPTKPCRGGPCGRPGQRSCPQDTQGGHHDVRRSEKQRIYL